MTYYNKGFIALFFTLGISSILMAYVAISSEHIFAFLHTRDGFIRSRAELQDELMCADQYANVVIQTYALPELFTMCDITHEIFIRENSDTITFSFETSHVHLKGTIFRGRISEIQTLYISL